MLYKLDLKRAYDHVNWGFLVVSVEEMWIWGEMSQMDNLLDSVVCSFILINGSPTSLFSSSRGLRQRSFILSIVCCYHGSFE